VGASVLRHFKDIRSNGLPVIREALFSNVEECARNIN
jgi:hypothetical protein